MCAKGIFIIHSESWERFDASFEYFWSFSVVLAFLSSKAHSKRTRASFPTWFLVNDVLVIFVQSLWIGFYYSLVSKVFFLLDRLRLQLIPRAIKVFQSPKQLADELRPNATSFVQIRSCAYLWNLYTYGIAEMCRFKIVYQTTTQKQ